MSRAGNSKFDENEIYFVVEWVNNEVNYIIF